MLTTNSSAAEYARFIDKLDDFAYDSKVIEPSTDVLAPFTHCEDRSYYDNGTIYIQRTYVGGTIVKKYVTELYMRFVITDEKCIMDVILLMNSGLAKDDVIHRSSKIFNDLKTYLGDSISI